MPRERGNSTISLKAPGVEDFSFENGERPLREVALDVLTHAASAIALSLWSVPSLSLTPVRTVSNREGWIIYPAGNGIQAYTLRLIALNGSDADKQFLEFALVADAGHAVLIFNKIIGAIPPAK